MLLLTADYFYSMMLRRGEGGLSLKSKSVWKCSLIHTGTATQGEDFFFDLQHYTHGKLACSAFPNPNELLHL